MVGARAARGLAVPELRPDCFRKPRLIPTQFAPRTTAGACAQAHSLPSMMQFEPPLRQRVAFNPATITSRAAGAAVSPPAPEATSSTPTATWGRPLPAGA